MADEETTFFDGRWFTRGSAGKEPPSLEDRLKQLETVGGISPELQTLVGSHTSQLTQLTDRIALEVARLTGPRIDVSKYTPGGAALSNANIDDALDAAIAAAYAISGTGLMAATIAQVYVPPGVWRITRTHVFPARGYSPCPAFWCAGEYSTIFLVGSELAGAPAFRFGQPTYVGPANALYAFGLVGRFSVIAETEFLTHASGIEAWNTINSTFSNIRMRGLFHPDMRWNEGYGFWFGSHKHNSEIVNHQHLLLRDLNVEFSMIGYYVGCCGPAQAYNCHSHGAMFENRIFDGCMIEWYGNNNQFKGEVGPAGTFWGAGTRYTAGTVSGFGQKVGAAVSGCTLGVAADGLCTLQMPGQALLYGDGGENWQSNMARWVEISTAGESANERKVRGMYKIHDVPSQTSLVLRKGTDHELQTGLTAQIREGFSGNDVMMVGDYDEATNRLASYGFYKHAVKSHYVLRNARSYGPDLIVEANNTERLTVQDISTSGRMSLRCVDNATLDVDQQFIQHDDFSYPGLVCRSRMEVPAEANRYAGWRDSQGGRQRRLQSLGRELGAIEMWAPRVAATRTLSGNAFVSLAGLVHGSTTQLVPSNPAAPPLFDANDPVGPCVSNQLGDSGHRSYLRCEIPASKLPGHPFMCTIVLVARLPNTAVASNGARRIQISTNGAGGKFCHQILGIHDNSYAPTGVFGGWFGNARAEYHGGTVLLPAAMDTAPHVWLVAGTSGAKNAPVVAAASDMDGLVNGYGAAQWQSHCVGSAMSVMVGTYDDSPGTDPLNWSFLGIWPRMMSRAEQQQFIDIALTLP